MPNSLDSDQDQRSACPDLCHNCFLMLLADDIWIAVNMYLGRQGKDHRRLRPYMATFLTSRSQLLSLWCDVFSISAIGESNGKNQLSIPSHQKDMAE